MDRERGERRYSRSDIAEILKRSSVGIAGAGGLGSNAAMSLARAGVGRLVIVDFDEVEGSNLNRQYYFLDQVGRPKLECLKENIERAVDGCRVETRSMKLEKGSMAHPFSDVDVVVEALDRASTKAAFIEEVMLEFPEKPIVAASGVAGIGSSERIVHSRYGKLHLIEDPEARSSDDEVLLAPKVCLFANYQANVVLELLLEVHG